MALQTPNYTQVPNSLFEQMGDMSEAELKITLAVVRMTIGYHQERKRMSFTYLQQATGLSKSAVNKGIQEALERGTVKRVPYKNSFEYHPNFVSNAEERSTEATDNGNQKLPKSVAKSYSNKETSKETKKNDRENLQKSVTKQKRKRDPVFDAIAKHLFNVDPFLKLPDSFGPRIARCRSRVVSFGKQVGLPVTGKTIVAFTIWYRSKNPTASMVRDADKFMEHFAAFYADLCKPQETTVPEEIAAPRILSPEEIARQRATLKAARQALFGNAA